MAIKLVGPLFLSNQLSSSAFFAGIRLAAYAILFGMLSAKKFQ